MKADLHSWEFLGIPRNSQKAGNSFRKGGELQHLAILPLHCHFILFIKFSLLSINPYMAVWIANFFSRQQRVIADLLFGY